MSFIVVKLCETVDGIRNFKTKSKTNIGTSMKKLLFIVIAIGILSLNAISQPSLDWAIAPAGNSSDIGNSITSDLSGNVYLTGSFQRYCRF